MNETTKILIGLVAFPVIAIGSTVIADKVEDRNFEKRTDKALAILKSAFSGRTVKPLKKMTDEEVGKLLDDARTELAFRKIVQNQD